MLKVNPLADSFSSILMNVSDYEKQLEDVTGVITETVENIDQKNFLSIDFLEEYKNYPKYPIDFKVIHNLNKYNVLMIYNCAQNDIEYMIDAIFRPDVLSLKGGFDLIPTTEILQDFNFQTTFFTKISNEFFESAVFTEFSKDRERRSYLYKTFGYFVPKELKESSLILNYSIYMFLVKNLRFSLKLFENIFYSKAVELRKNDPYSDAFTKYIDTNSDSLAEYLVRFILAYTYKITNPSGTFLRELVSLISQKLKDLKDFFKYTLMDRDSISSEIILYGSDILYQYVSSKFTNSAADPSLGILTTEQIEAIKRFELDIYESITNKYSPQTLKDYLYLVYHYKLTPKKFLNVLQLTLQNYAKQNLIDYNQNEFNFFTLQSYFYQIFGTLGNPNGSLNLNVLVDFLKEIVTKDYILETIEQERLVEFATRIKMIYFFEDIFNMENKEFSGFIDEIYSIFFDYLKDTVQVDPYYPHYFNRKMLFWYLLSCFKRDILQNKIFMKEEVEIYEMFQELLSSESYKPNFNLEKMRARTIQFMEGNIVNITTLFENILETAVEKKLHSENITYFLS